MFRSKIRSIGILIGGLLLALGAFGAAPAGAALPPGYTVQRIDSPLPATNGGFGNQSISIGDVNNDGMDDFAVLQFAGSAPQPPNVPAGQQAGAGIIWEFSGATGEVLKSVNAGDNGGTRGNTGVDTFIGRMTDLGSCADAPAQVPGQPGPTCASATVGLPDGVNEILIGLGGVDVAGIPDVGRAYVLDGKTLAILKKIDMPPADRALIAARIAVNPVPADPTAANSVRGSFGRTVASPRGLPPCAGNSGIGTCLSQETMPTPVRIGDIDNGGFGDIIVGANQFPETGATAHPDSECAHDAGTATCLGAGRAYVYRGEDIAGSNPAVILDTPFRTQKNIAAQTDDPFGTRDQHFFENFGHSQIPIGDVGSCTQVGIQPGERCPFVSRSTVVDAKPDYIISSHRSETPIFDPDPANFEVGASMLFDGATGAILYIYNHPESQPNALFGFTTGEQFAVGDLGDTSHPDAVFPAMQNAQGKAEAGRGYVFSGLLSQNMINFAIIDDPTPNTFGRFGNPTEGVGDLVGATQVRNEVLAGQFSAVQTAGKADTSFDVSFMNPANNQALQTISDPDAQPESGFGSRLFPLGDLNGDGFLDFAVASVRWDGGTPTLLDPGRLYIFRSDPNAAVPGPPALPAGPAGPAGSPGPAGGSTAATVLAGRTVDLDASKSTVRRNASIKLRGVVEAFANTAACEPGQSVQIQRRAPSGTRFTTFQKVKTSASGTFSSSSFKVASTTYYRARVLQTDACEGAQSSREKVTVRVSKKAAAAALRRARAVSLRNH